LGVNGAVRLGLIGAGGMGRFLTKCFIQQPGVIFPVVCDVDLNHAAKINHELLEGKADLLQDYRQVLDRADIDAVVIATPDHWHAIALIHACQAGKDAYVEKPLIHSVAEGPRMIEAVRRYNRVVQVGTQQLSSPHYVEAAEIVQSGGIGRVVHVRTWNTENLIPGMGFPDGDPKPETLDWDMWLGPAPVVPYHQLRAGPSYRCFWDYAGGTIVDWGTHHIASVHHIMGQDRPLSAFAIGGHFGMQDMSEMPDTMNALWEYPGGWNLEYSLRLSSRQNGDGSQYGIMFHGTEAALYIDRCGYEIIPEKDSTPARKVGRPRVDACQAEPLHAPHIVDFLECLRSRGKPRADITAGYRATVVPILANISMTVGRKIRWDADRDTITDDPQAESLMNRRYREPYVLPEVSK
jgi:predicted dehydrogenase